MKTIGGGVASDLPRAFCRRRTPESLVGKLVHFDKRGRSTQAKAPASGDAQIYLFTGVRYERETNPAPGKPAGSAARAKRRRV
jgi:hypothetical protein